MNLRRKNVAIAILTATLMASGIMTTANAAEDDDVRSVTIQQGYTVDANTMQKKTSASGSNAYITFKSRVPADDIIIVNVKNQNDNIVSTEDGYWRGIASGTKKSLKYQSGKGKKGNEFYPSFTLARGSQSTSLLVKYIFEP